MTAIGRYSRVQWGSGLSASAAPDSSGGAYPSSSGAMPEGKISVDGWTLDNNTWQGVRTYDASAGQWNTPDAYAGDVHDPMSQKPFMWNRNNPYEYADPSGYDAIELVYRRVWESIPNEYHSYIRVTRHEKPSVNYSFGPEKGVLRKEGQGYEDGHPDRYARKFASCDGIFAANQTVVSTSAPWQGSRMHWIGRGLTMMAFMAQIATARRARSVATLAEIAASLISARSSRPPGRRPLSRSVS